MDLLQQHREAERDHGAGQSPGKEIPYNNYTFTIVYLH